MKEEAIVRRKFVHLHMTIPHPIIRLCRLAVILLALAPASVSAQFYKDLFMDGGIKLEPRHNLPAAEALGLSMEFYACPRPYGQPATRQDTLLQSQLYAGSEADHNGILLYPDGEPRFRVIYVNGGLAAAHGNSLGADGLERMREFVANGGSYVGTCAGAFFASRGFVGKEGIVMRDTSYLGVWPGLAAETHLYDACTGMTVEEGSPLLGYSDFGGDMRVDSLFHTNGCFACTLSGYPDVTEALLRYDFDDAGRKTKIDGEISVWAYKKEGHSGRVVVTGSHPEKAESGERLELMAAMLRYALDGQGAPKVKARLRNGESREMFRATPDGDPAHTMIGDRQCHHFTIDVPVRARKIKVELDGDPSCDLYLCANRGDFAFSGKAAYRNTRPGSRKSLTIRKPEEGTWYIGVECATTVDVEKTEWGYRYTGRTDVLNGVPYSIKASRR